MFIFLLTDYFVIVVDFMAVFIISLGLYEWMCDRFFCMHLFGF